MNNSINFNLKGSESISSRNYHKITLPSGKEVSFRQIIIGEVKMILRNYRDCILEWHCSLEELIAAYALKKKMGLQSWQIINALMGTIS